MIISALILSALNGRPEVVMSATYGLTYPTEAEPVVEVHVSKDVELHEL